MNWLFITMSTLLVACSSMKEKGQAHHGPSEYQKVATSALGDSLQYNMNADSTLVLCQRIRRLDEPPYLQMVNYCVIALSTTQIIHQAHFANGSVTWHGKKQLLIRNFKGYPTVNGEGLYIYDLEVKKRIQPGIYHGQRDKEKITTQ